MPVYEYSALSSEGRKRKGLVAAEGPSAARFKLSQEEIFPVEIREVVESAKNLSSESFLSRLPGLGRINPIELSTAMRQFATLLSSGLPLVDCLNGIIEQSENARLKRTFTQIRERVLEGSSLCQSMAAYPSLFGHIHVSMVKAGETGGALDVVLRRLADFSEKRIRLKRKIESAMTYPVFLVMISTVILIFLMTFVMPKVITIFEGMKMALPWSTRTLIVITHFISHYWWAVVACVILVPIFASMLVRTERGRRVWDRVSLYAPLFGRLHQKAVIARFTRTLSVLLRSGIPLIGSLEIAAPSMGNRVMEERVKEVIRSVSEGSGLATPLRQKGGFPPLVVQLVRAGEQSGELENMLAKAAEEYEDDVESAIGSLTSILEPMVILVMAVIVGFVVLAILLPIFDMTAGIKIL